MTATVEENKLPINPTEFKPTLLDYLSDGEEHPLPELYRNLLGEDAASYAHQNSVRVTLGLLARTEEVVNVRRGVWRIAADTNTKEGPLASGYTPSEILRGEVGLSPIGDTPASPILPVVPTSLASAVPTAIDSTTEYDVFKFHPQQRWPLDRRHIEKIKTSMRAHGFIPSYHITVNEAWEIVDGQHRFQAAKELGIPLWYTIADIPIQAVQQAGGTVKKWSKEDYVSSYVKQGLPAYIKVRDLQEESGLSTARVLYLSRITTSTNADVYHRFTAGRLREEDVETVHVMAVVKALEEMQEYIPHLTTKGFFQYALSHCMRQEGYSHARMMEKIAYQSGKFHIQGEVNSYIAILEEVYNYRIQGGSSNKRMRFTRISGKVGRVASPIE